VYEVACPSCRVVVTTPFVRVGAAVTCASCGHRYLIGQTHFKQIPTAARTPAEGQTQPGTPPDATDTTKAHAPAQQGAAQDLSEVMRIEAQRERDSQFDDYDTIKPAADEPRKPIDPGPVAPTPSVKQTKAQKVGRSGYLLAAAAALALAVLGGGLWMLKWDLGSGSASSTLQDLPTEPVYQGPLFQGLPLAVSSALEHNPWTRPNQPYQSQPQDDPAVFVADGKLVPSQTGAIQYIGRVVSERDDVIVAGELTISLINRQGTEKARTTVPITMLSKDHPMPVRVLIPPTLDPSLLNPVWSISAIESLDPLVPIQDVSMQSKSMGSDTMALVYLGNDSDLRVDRVVFLITAWDAQALPLRRWQVQWDSPLSPGKDTEFYARTAVPPSWEIDAWTILAFAQPSPVQPAPSPAQEQAD
jgi:hypothetical protein